MYEYSSQWLAITSIASKIDCTSTVSIRPDNLCATKADRLRVTNTQIDSSLNDIQFDVSICFSGEEIPCAVSR